MPQNIVEQNIAYQRREALETDIASLVARVERLEAARPPPDGRPLTQEEAAAVIGVKPPTLAAWRHYKKGPRWLKIGRSAFYRPADIAEWLDQQVVVPDEEDSPRKS